MCRAGCPIMTEELMEKTKYCEFRKAFYEVILKGVDKIKNGRIIF